jgi:organic radical activating enzyme
VNEQPISKQELDPEGRLLVHSTWETIQGEGPFAGRPAIFVRLGGCNLRCPACDTDYTDGTVIRTVKELLAIVTTYTLPTKLVVITGGEPFRQNIGPFVEALLKSNFEVQIETAGTLFVPGPWDRVTIVCSPKTGRVNPLLRPYISAYKYIIDAENVSPRDGLPSWTMRSLLGPQIARPPEDFEGPIYVQPLDDSRHKAYAKDNNKANRRAAVRSCLKYGYTLCLQLHKIVGLD